MKAYPSEENTKNINWGWLNVELRKETAQWASGKKLSMGMNCWGSFTLVHQKQKASISADGAGNNGCRRAVRGR